MSQLILFPFLGDDTMLHWAGSLMLRLYTLSHPVLLHSFRRKTWDI